MPKVYCLGYRIGLMRHGLYNTIRPSSEIDPKDFRQELEVGILNIVKKLIAKIPAKWKLYRSDDGLSTEEKRIEYLRTEKFIPAPNIT